MKTKGSPFAFIDGQPYLVANFTLDPAFGFPSLIAILDDLLNQVSGEDILLLRKLSNDEAKLLAEYTENYEHEAWAVIVASGKKDKK